MDSLKRFYTLVIFIKLLFLVTSKVFQVPQSPVVSHLRFSCNLQASLCNFFKSGNHIETLLIKLLNAILTLCPTGEFCTPTTATGNDRPREKTIVEGNPYPPPLYGVQNAYEVVCVSGEGPLVPNPPSYWWRPVGDIRRGPWRPLPPIHRQIWGWGDA